MNVIRPRAGTGIVALAAAGGAISGCRATSRHDHVVTSASPHRTATSAPAPRVVSRIFGQRSTCPGLHGALLSVPGVGGRRVVLVDPLTLRPIRGTTMRMPTYVDELMVGPDGCSVAFTDLGHLGVLDPVRRVIVSRSLVTRHQPFYGGRPFYPSGPPLVTPVSWPTTDRLIADASYEQAHLAEPAVAIVMNPRTQRVLRRIPLNGAVDDAVSSRDGAVFLVTGVNRTSTARIAVVTTDGVLRTVELPGIQAGLSIFGDGQARDIEPGLAVHGDTAWVVGANALIAKIDLRRLSVSVHRVPRLFSVRAMSQRASDIGSEGPIASDDFSCTYLGRGRLLVSNGRQRPTHGGRKEIDSVGIASMIVDARTGSVESVLRGDQQAHAAAGLVFGWHNDSNGDVNRLDVWHPDGTRAYRLREPSSYRTWRLFAGRLIRYAYDGKGVSVELDPRTGQPVGQVGPSGYWLLSILMPARAGAVGVASY